ncbi:MAG: hypothetical protein ABFE01_22505 [Phycisphaerales bacterium]
MGQLTPEQAAQITQRVQCKTEARFRRAFSDKKLIDKAKELFDAKKTVSCVGGKDAGAGTVDFVDVPDYRVQLDTMKFIAEVSGRIKKKVDMNHTGAVKVEVVRFADDDPDPK